MMNCEPSYISFKVCRAREMNYVVRLLKKDLRIDAADKTVLDGLLLDDAYDAFKKVATPAPLVTTISVDFMTVPLEVVAYLYTAIL